VLLQGVAKTQLNENRSCCNILEAVSQQQKQKGRTEFYNIFYE